MVKVQKKIIFPSKVFISVRQNSKNCSFLVIFLKTLILNAVFIADFQIASVFSLQKKLLLEFKITKRKKKTVIDFFPIKLLMLFRELAVFVYNKLKILGVGFSFSVKENLIYCAVGASMLLFFKVPFSIIVEVLGRKSTILLVCGSSIVFVNQFCTLLVNLRYPNIYTGKGIFFFRKKVIRKLGKLQKK